MTKAEATLIHRLASDALRRLSDQARDFSWSNTDWNNSHLKVANEAIEQIQKAAAAELEGGSK